MSLQTSYWLECSHTPFVLCVKGLMLHVFLQTHLKGCLISYVCPACSTDPSQRVNIVVMPHDHPTRLQMSTSIVGKITAMASNAGEAVQLHSKLLVNETSLSTGHHYPSWLPKAYGIGDDFSNFMPHEPI